MLYIQVTTYAITPLILGLSADIKVAVAKAGVFFSICRGLKIFLKITFKSFFPLYFSVIKHFKVIVYKILVPKFWGQYIC